MLVIAATRYRLRRVEGVEVSPELAAISRANVERLRPRLRCQDVKVTIGDAAQLPVPDDASIIYVYNALTDGPFEQFVNRLLESMRRRPRRLRLIYRHPTQANVLAASGHFRHVRTARGLSGRGHRERIALYEILSTP
jgi:hypothetical protein